MTVPQQIPSQPSGEGLPTMTAFVVYVFYLIAVFVVVSVFVGFAAVIGVIVAYTNQRGAPAWLKSHYSFQIRTFWIGLVFLVASSALPFVFLYFGSFAGFFITSNLYFLILFPWMLWLVVRVAKGMKRLGQAKPILPPIM